MLYTHVLKVAAGGTSTLAGQLNPDRPITWLTPMVSIILRQVANGYNGYGPPGSRTSRYR